MAPRSRLALGGAALAALAAPGVAAELCGAKICPWTTGAVDSLGAWTLVRRVSGTTKWHKASDLLAGTEVYGTAHTDPKDGASFSEDFSAAVPTWNQMMFTYGDGSEYLVATKTAVYGGARAANATYYGANALRDVIKSSRNNATHQIRWSKVNQTLSHPLIRLTNTGDNFLYVGNEDTSYASSLTAARKGANVFIRHVAPKKTAAKTSRGGGLLLLLILCCCCIVCAPVAAVVGAYYWTKNKLDADGDGEVTMSEMLGGAKAVAEAAEDYVPDAVGDAVGDAVEVAADLKEQTHDQIINFNEIIELLELSKFSNDFQ